MVQGLKNDIKLVKKIIVYFSHLFLYYKDSVSCFYTINMDVYICLMKDASSLNIYIYIYSVNLIDPFPSKIYYAVFVFVNCSKYWCK